MAKCKNCKNLLAKEEISIGHLHSYKWCPVINDNPDDERERNRYDFECMTNADRIRSMTDEELRDFMYDMTSESQCYVCAFKKGWLCEKPYDKSCQDGVMEWLKSEVGCE